MLLQLHDSRKRLAADYAALEGAIRKKANERILAERTRDDLNEHVPVLHGSLVAARKHNAIAEVVYHEQHDELSRQLGLVKRAYALLAN